MRGLIVVPTKSLVGREAAERPGHTLLPQRRRGRRRCLCCSRGGKPFPAAIPVVALGTAAIGTARVATGFHFPSDILAEWPSVFLRAPWSCTLRITLNARLRRFCGGVSLPGTGICLSSSIFYSRGIGNVRQFLLIFGPALGLVALSLSPPRCCAEGGAEDSLSRTRPHTALRWGSQLVIFFCYLFVTTRSTLWDRDETVSQRPTVEMVHSGDYLVPTLTANSGRTSRS